MDFDFIIVGAGSAGCVLANRLTSDASNRVLLLEAGPDNTALSLKMPAAVLSNLTSTKHNWAFQGEPEPELNGRRIQHDRGKTIGGSSSINGMVYVRGHAGDFDHWAEQGAHGWAYADVLPYYKRMESWDSAGHGGDPDWRGTDGPLHAQRGSRENPLHAAFVAAGQQAGYQTTDDYNGEKQEGFGPMDQTVWRGQRWSAANAYLKPALRREGCDLVRAFARRVVIEDGRARGVEVERGGAIEVIGARREVILAASAINSPKLLMLSGIGEAAHLNEHGIDVVADRPGVGGNLQDHLEVYIQVEAKQPITLYRYWPLLRKAQVGMWWLLFKRGPGASNQFESAAFFRSAAGVAYPDVQYHFLPLAVRYDGTVAAKAHGFQIHTGPMRSASRGRVRLTGADAAADPSILFNYMSQDSDWRDFRAAIRLTREVLDQPAFAPHSKREIQPGPALQSDDEVDGFIREHAESAYHPCGTCRMGRANDAGAVVDPQCRVIGVDGLRVADSSIFPRITNGNLNGPSIMVGEKASDHILGRDPLPADNAAPWWHPAWETQQR